MVRRRVGDVKLGLPRKGNLGQCYEIVLRFQRMRRRRRKGGAKKCAVVTLAEER